MIEVITPKGNEVGQQNGNGPQFHGEECVVAPGGVICIPINIIY